MGGDVLVVVFGLGDLENQGIGIGIGRPEHRPQRSAFQRSMEGCWCRMTLLTTQPYGGGWMCIPSIGSRTVPAASQPVYADAIVDRLLLEPMTGKRTIGEDDKHFKSESEALDIAALSKKIISEKLDKMVVTLEEELEQQIR